MSKPKVSNNTIIDLNNVGISLRGISKRTGLHYSTVTARLKEINVKPIDTRRNFMEEIFDSLSLAQQEWLMNQLGPSHTVKDYVKSLILHEYINKNKDS